MAVNKIYFANLTGDDLGVALKRAVERSQRHTISTGLWNVWVRAHNAYFGAATDGHSSRALTKKGPKGEFTSFVINHYRNLLTHYQILAAGQDPDMEPQAATGESEAETEVQRARGILAHYGRDGFQDVQMMAVESAVVLGAGWSRVQWNTKRGDPVLPALEAAGDDPGAPEELSGAMEFDAFKPNDVFFEPGLKNARRFPWVITRRPVLRWDLAADFPEMEDEILGYTRSQLDLELSFDSVLHPLGAPVNVADDGTIMLYELWHDRTPACRNGRMANFLGNGKMLLEDQLPYRQMPVRRVAPADFLDSAHGYAPGWDLLGLQDYVNMTASVRATNQRAWGVGIIAAPKGAEVEAHQITHGLHFMKYNAGAGKPEMMNFTGTPAEVIAGQKMAVDEMETISGVNSVVRGNPEASLKSGSALALVQAQAVQMTAPVQKNIASYMSRSAEDLLGIFQDYASQPVQIEIMGNGGALISEYSGKDIAMVRRVQVKPGNPLTATPAGRLQLVQLLLNIPGAVQDPAQIWRVIETGRTDPMSERPSRQRRNVHQENEMLARAKFLTDASGQPQMQPRLGPNGMPVVKDGPGGGVQMMEEALDTESLPIAMGTDDWRLHIPEHLSMLDSPEARRNPAVRRAVLWHIQDHVRKTMQIQTTMPAMMEMAGIPMLQSVAGMQMATGPTAPQPPQGHEKGAAKDSGEPQPNPPPGSGQMPRLPHLPPGSAMATGMNPAAPGPGGSQ